MKKNLDNLFNLLFAGLITLCISMLAHISHWPVILIIFLISYPWKIKGNVFSLFGGANCSGSVYSLCPLIQVAKKNALGIIGPTLYQKAEENALLLISACNLQKAKSSCIIFGLAVNQVAENDCVLCAGGAFSQSSDGRVACAIGMVIFQTAKNEAYVGFGIPLFQKAEETGIDWERAKKISDFD